MTHILGKLDLHPHHIRQALKLSLVVICNNSITSFENSSLYFKQRYIQDILDEYLCTFWYFSVFWWCYLQTSFAFGRQPPIDTGRVLVLYSSLYCTVLLWMKLYGEKLPTQRVTAALHYNYIEEVPWFYASKFKRTVICIISKMFQMTFLFIFTPRAWLHIIIFFCFDSTTDGSFTQAFWCQQASSSDRLVHNLHHRIYILDNFMAISTWPTKNLNLSTAEHKFATYQNYFRYNVPH